MSELDALVVVGRMSSYRLDKLEAVAARLRSRPGSKALFVYATREAPIRIAGRTYMPVFHGLVNLTFTHRTDSDVYFPYGLVIPKNPGQIFTLQ